MKNIKTLLTIMAGIMFVNGCSIKYDNVNIVEINELDTECKSDGPSGSLYGLEFEYYKDIYKKVQEKWELPPNLEKRNFKSIIVVQISRDGNIQKLSYENNSGSQEFDSLALKAIYKSTPFPEFPVNFNKNCLQVGLVFLPKENKF